LSFALSILEIIPLATPLHRPSGLSPVGQHHRCADKPLLFRSVHIPALCQGNVRATKRPISRRTLRSIQLRSLPLGAQDRPQGKHAFSVREGVPPRFPAQPISDLPNPYSGAHSKLWSLRMTLSTTFEDMRAGMNEARTSENPDRALPRHPARAKSSVAAFGERADDYSHVVVLLDAKTRVIAADIQWIIQRRINGGRYPWQSQYYFRSKSGLLFYAKSDAPELLALPDWFPERGARDWAAMWSKPFHRPELL
jgi:hypothetical protein